jgi:hypothetical protein
VKQKLKSRHALTEEVEQIGFVPSPQEIKEQEVKTLEINAIAPRFSFAGNR